LLRIETLIDYLFVVKLYKELFYEYSQIFVSQGISEVLPPLYCWLAILAFLIIGFSQLAKADGINWTNYIPYPCDTLENHPWEGPKDWRLCADTTQYLNDACPGCCFHIIYYERWDNYPGEQSNYDVYIGGIFWEGGTACSQCSKYTIIDLFYKKLISYKSLDSNWHIRSSGQNPPFYGHGNTEWILTPAKCIRINNSVCSVIDTCCETLYDLELDSLKGFAISVDSINESKPMTICLDSCAVLCKQVEFDSFDDLSIYCPAAYWNLSKEYYYPPCNRNITVHFCNYCNITNPQMNIDIKKVSNLCPGADPDSVMLFVRNKLLSDPDTLLFCGYRYCSQGALEMILRSPICVKLDWADSLLSLLPCEPGNDNDNNWCRSIHYKCLNDSLPLSVVQLIEGPSSVGTPDCDEWQKPNIGPGTIYPFDYIPPGNKWTTVCFELECGGN
jgi:hypothetical protein